MSTRAAKLAALGITGAALYDYYTKGRRWYPAVNKGIRAISAVKSSRAAKAVAAVKANRTFSRRFARDQALQLGRLTYPSVIKHPFDGVGMWADSSVTSDNWSATVRFCPFGATSLAVGLGQAWTTCFKGDKRFQTLCTLYAEFRLVSVTYRIQVVNAAGDLFKDDSGAKTNDITIFGKVIRNVGYSATPYTDFQSSEDKINCPGIIWARPASCVRYPSLNVTIKPSGTKERSQWYSTANDGESQLEWLANDTSLEFFPALDVAFHTARGSKGVGFIYYSCVMRAVVQFRSGKVPLASDTRATIAQATSSIALKQNVLPGTNIQDVAHSVVGIHDGA